MDERDSSSSSSFSLDELSARSGFDRRVIRSFIEQGLLRGANSMGRYASYSNAHLTRLLAIRTMKESLGLSISEIRTSLITMSEDELINLAYKGQSQQGSDSRMPSDSALDYILCLQGEKIPPLAAPSTAKPTQEEKKILPPELPEALPWNKTPIDLLLLELIKMRERKTVRKQSKAEAWHRIPITPDFELSVRGINDAEQLSSLERVADYLREILLGGQYE